MNFYISDLHFGHYNIILPNYADRPFLHVAKENIVYFNDKVVIECATKEEATNKAKTLSLKLMEETMISRWNSKVSNSDTVFIGGDFGFCSEQEMARILKLLNGKKVLVEGNHDKSKKTMLNMGFDEVHDTLHLNLNNNKVVMNHYPYISAEFNHIAALRPNIIKLDTKTNKLPEIPSNFNYEDSKKFLLKNYSHPINLAIDSKKNVFNYLKRAISMHIGSRLINNGVILIHGHTHKKVKRFANMINISCEAWDYTPASEDEIILEINNYIEEINGNTISIENCNDDVYNYYTSLSSSVNEFKEIKNLCNLYKRIKQAQNDPSYRKISIPQGYSSKWYNIAVEHNMFIPINKLEIDCFYDGYCRNASWAYWDGECFYYYRNKFGSTFIEKIECPEKDNGFDLFVPHNKKEDLSEEEKDNFIKDYTKYKAN